MTPVVLANPDITLTAPAGMENCGSLTAVKFDEDGARGFVSLWKPNVAELRALMQGGSIALAIHGTGHPPVALGVNDVFGNLVE